MITALLLFLSALAGEVAHAAYAVVCVELRGAPVTCPGGFNPFDSWLSFSLLVAFGGLLTMGISAWINAVCANAATTTRLMLSLGVGWSIWGMVAPLLT
ncbi:hypothetical protein JK364_51200 [Streptomyces sp. 110]|uniref:Integral membrane protein n=1 Tax=Streptomyces endocoffeicus TaxID=2898945 RepID=A0ABS1Q8C4_9ACTN|nr:hypothetical protein [Streptomyces endocoffeicus]MBL1120600.1 hypothetical protein [Streptomyces endocoffeicus]